MSTEKKNKKKNQAVSELPNEHLHVWIFYKFESKHKYECISYETV